MLGLARDIAWALSYTASVFAAASLLAVIGFASGAAETLQGDLAELTLPATVAAYAVTGLVLTPVVAVLRRVFTSRIGALLASAVLVPLTLIVFSVVIGFSLDGGEIGLLIAAGGVVGVVTAQIFYTERTDG